MSQAQQSAYFFSLRSRRGKADTLQKPLATHTFVSEFGLFEWRVRLRGDKAGAAALVFPLATAVGGAMLLTHSHAIANIKDQLLVEMSHTPLALCGITAGWARWLELRLGGRVGKLASWLWPVAFILVGLILLIYRES